MNLKMNIRIDPYAGFCPGVVRAIQIAEQELRKHGQLYCLGEIVHNQLEVERLEKLGLKTILYDDFRDLKDTRVLLRSHGEPPETYRIAKKNNVELIDATCPVVLKLQKKVKKNTEEMKMRNGQLVIFGKKDHPEVKGLVGQTDNTAKIIGPDGKFEHIDPARPVRLFAQTTMQSDGYKSLRKKLKKKMQEHLSGQPDFVAHHTICKQVEKRIPKLKEFASAFEVIIFVSGKNSSNGKYLYSICENTNPDSYFISDREDLDIKWLKDKSKVGISGATSTPFWLLEDIAQAINEL